MRACAWVCVQSLTGPVPSFHFCASSSNLCFCLSCSMREEEEEAEGPIRHASCWAYLLHTVSFHILPLSHTEILLLNIIYVCRSKVCALEYCHPKKTTAGQTVAEPDSFPLKFPLNCRVSGRLVRACVCTRVHVCVLVCLAWC